MRAASLLRADLHDSLVLPGRVHHRSPFDDVVRQRLFGVHVLAGGAGGNEDVGMPVVRRADDDGVDVFAVDNLAEVLNGLHILSGPACLFHICDGIGNPLFIRIAEGGQFDFWHLQKIPEIGPAHAAAADEGDSDLFVGRHRLFVIGPGPGCG